MPSYWTGPVEDRYADLDRSRRRCDANNRRCTHPATVSLDLLPAKDFVVIPGGEPERKQACSRHLRQFARNHQWVVMGTKPIGSRVVNDTTEPTVTV
jgi:hypothetical protein